MLAALHHKNESALLVSETILHVQRGQTLKTVASNAQIGTKLIRA